MFEKFTDKARRVVVLAQEEAKLLNHNYIGTEHILLGLIHEGEGVAAKALEALGINLEQVREQVRSRGAGAFERIRIRRRRDPHRAFRLYRTRQRTDAHLLSESVRTGERFAAPEGAHGVERAIQVRLPIGVVRRRKREIVRVPPRSQRDARTAVRQRVDDRPVLDEAHRMMQWGDDTAGLQAHVLRAHGQGRVQHRR